MTIDASFTMYIEFIFAANCRSGTALYRGYFLGNKTNEWRI